MDRDSRSLPFTFQGAYGPLLRPVMRRLFHPITVPELFKAYIQSLASQGHVVYALAAGSTTDALLLNQRLKEEGLPAPMLVFDRTFPLFQPVTDSMRNLVERLRGRNPFTGDTYRSFMQDRSRASLVFLDEGPSRRKPDVIMELIKLQRTIDTPVFIVPLRIVYQRSPLKLKDTTDEERLRITEPRKLLILMRGRERGFVEHGSSLNLRDELGRALSAGKFLEELAQEITSELRHSLAVLGSNVSGAPIRERPFIIDKTMRDPILQSFLRSYANDDPKALREAESAARRHLDQIAADLTPSTINFLDRSLSWVFNNIFEGLDVDAQGLQAVRERARTGSLVYVPCHKSHIDYLILSCCLYQNWMSVPVIAAGINLSFFPIGTLLRKGGAFFMRRSFRDNPLYAQTFSAYVRTILGERIPMEFFIEGTRSRSGKLMLPKKGLLSMIIQGWEAGVSRDVIFVPVYLGYDTVVEEKAYIREMKGAPKEKENLWGLLKAGSILKNRYGKVYIRFAPPISMTEYMRSATGLSRMTPEEKDRMYEEMAQTIISAIYRQTVATPISVMSCVLLSLGRALDEHEVRTGFHLFLEYLKHQGCSLSSTLSNEDMAFKDAVAVLQRKGILTIDPAASPGEPDLMVVRNEDRIHLEYYKNTILNFFVPVSLVSNILLKNRGSIAEKNLQKQVQNLADLLGKEFILDLESFNEAVRFMTAQGIVTVNRGTYTASQSAVDVLRLFGGLVENYLESYLCVASNLARIQDTPDKNILKTINRHAERMFKRGEIKRFESLCLPVYKGALDTFREKGLIDANNRIADKARIEELVHEIRGLLEN
jgi:glycerol-3-phosphate O-acyltransferase